MMQKMITKRAIPTRTGRRGTGRIIEEEDTEKVHESSIFIQ